MTAAAAALPARRAGIGLRRVHQAEVIASPPDVGWLEVHAENFMCGGPALRALERVREAAVLSVHGVGLSLGSAAGLDERHLARLARLVERVQPALVSEHLAWSVADGRYLNDLLPLPYDDATLALAARHVDRVQERLGRRILVENPSTYLRFRDSTLSEAAFLVELARRSGCGLLLDVNNLYVNCANHGGDPLAYLAALPVEAVGEMHLAGHAVNRLGDAEIRIDDHGSPVPEAVWRLYAAAVRRFPAAPTLVEWDTRLPPLADLVAEAHEADFRRSAALQEAVHVGAG